MKNDFLYFLLVAVCFFGSQSNGQNILPTQSREDAQAIIDRIQDLENQPHHPYSPEPISSVAAKILFFQLDPASYGEAAKQLIKRDDKETLVDLDIIQAWARRDPKAAFEFIEGVKPGWLNYSFCYELCEQWAATDPVSALEAAKNASANSKELLLKVLAVIAVDSPGRALEMLPEKESRQYGFANDVLAYWAGKSPDDAVKWAMAQPKRHDILWTLGFMWAQKDRPAAEAWVKSLAGDDHTCALAGMINERLQSYLNHPGDPVLAAREFSQAFPDAALNQETLPNQTVKSLASAIASRLPARGPDFDGLGWVLSFRDSPGRDEMFDVMIGNWIESHRGGALPYIEAMEPGTRKKRALARYVFHSWKEDPQLNFKLASTLEDESMRTWVLADVFQQWLLKSPELAIQALHELPDAEQKKIKSLNSAYANSRRRQKPRED